MQPVAAAEDLDRVVDDYARRLDAGAATGGRAKIERALENILTLMRFAAASEMLRLYGIGPGVAGSAVIAPRSTSANRSRAASAPPEDTQGRLGIHPAAGAPAHQAAAPVPARTSRISGRRRISGPICTLHCNALMTLPHRR